jgi:serine/threonine-protein kinase
MSLETAPTPNLCGRTLDGKYALERFVAKGGYGAVYKGTHLALDCPVAVKVLVTPERYQGPMRARFLATFRQEARTIAALRHPAIVRVYDSGATEAPDGGEAYMVMEWLDGVTLEEDLRHRARGRSPREALDLLRPVFDAIAYAHEAGVAHRDLKPANVMVTPARRGEAPARVLDFGVARVMDPDEEAGTGFTRTSSEWSSFSLSHAAPEQVGRTRTGAWTDVHALALLLIEVLTGSRAYKGETSVDLYAAITARTRPTPGSTGLDIGPWERVLARALALTPSERHRDAGALLAELDATLDDAQRTWERIENASRPSHSPASVTPITPPEAPVRVSSAPPATPTPARRLWPVALIALAALAVGAYTRRAPSSPHPVRRVSHASIVSPASPALVREPETPHVPDASIASEHAAVVTPITPRRLVVPRRSARPGARPQNGEPEIEIE